MYFLLHDNYLTAEQAQQHVKHEQLFKSISLDQNISWFQPQKVTIFQNFYKPINQLMDKTICRLIHKENSLIAVLYKSTTNQLQQ